jgi:Peptidase family S58
VEVDVTGVGFFDFAHGQTGLAPNCIELHPVLAFDFSSPGAITSSPSRPRTALPPNGPRRGLPSPPRLGEEDLSPLFEAAIETTEEAIDNSILRATTVHGRDGHVVLAIPIDKLREVMKKCGR